MFNDLTGHTRSCTTGLTHFISLTRAIESTSATSFIRSDPCQHNCRPVSVCHHTEEKITACLRRNRPHTRMISQHMRMFFYFISLALFTDVFVCLLCAVFGPSLAWTRKQSWPLRWQLWLYLQTSGARRRRLFLLSDGEHLLYCYSHKTSPSWWSE